MPSSKTNKYNIRKVLIGRIDPKLLLAVVSNRGSKATDCIDGYGVVLLWSLIIGFKI